MLCCGINSHLAFLDVDRIFLKVYAETGLQTHSLPTIYSAIKIKIKHNLQLEDTNREHEAIISTRSVNDPNNLIFLPF